MWMGGAKDQTATEISMQPALPPEPFLYRFFPFHMGKVEAIPALIAFIASVYFGWTPGLPSAGSSEPLETGIQVASHWDAHTTSTNPFHCKGTIFLLQVPSWFVGALACAKGWTATKPFLPLLAVSCISCSSDEAWLAITETLDKRRLQV